MGAANRIRVAVVVALVAGVLAAQWSWSTYKSSDVTIVAALSPARVLADGKHKTVLSIQVLENGHPRRGDLLQIFMAQGGGILLPQWAYTDDRGRVRATYQPNPASPYDLQEDTSITIVDTSIGPLVEVDKQQRVHVTLTSPVGS